AIMVRSYQHKTDRSNLSEDIIEKAVKDGQKGLAQDAVLIRKSIEATRHL
ncbi:hypothetical protein AVEN_136489-1, partial [Araneus ventricosus]